jgi:MFS family permease
MAEIHAKKPKLAAAASFVGSTLEYYDFFIYGTASALVFGKLFFPTANPALGTIAALATFAIGNIGRPIGAAIIGHYGDKVGSHPRWDRNLNTGHSAWSSAVTAVARQRIFHDPDRPSRITVTVVD